MVCWFFPVVSCVGSVALACVVTCKAVAVAWADAEGRLAVNALACASHGIAVHHDGLVCCSGVALFTYVGIGG